MLKKDLTNLLKEALAGTGFVRRGSAFFRVWGDGVLQVLKFERERVYRVPGLRVGVFSMYGRLEPQWFTSIGCIPRGSVERFIGLYFVDGHLPPDRFTNNNGQFFYDGFPVTVDPSQRLWNDIGENWKYFFTPEQQIHILNEKVLPWLNAMTSQSLAAEGMYEICPIPNDALRFDAHLAAGEWVQAERAMAAIMNQHADAAASWKQTFSPEKYAQMMVRQEERDAPLIAVWHMIQEKDPDVIGRYLRENYQRNCELAKFCMK